MALRYSELMRKLPKVVPPLSPTRAIRDAEQARQRVAAFLEQGDGRTMVLTGAGISTASGIPDYRSPGRPPHRPMQHIEFVGHAERRQRYWARSFIGYPRVAGTQPNAGHLALCDAEHGGLVQHIVTQNVDGLHQKAGAASVLELHGTIHRVRCLQCGSTSCRHEYQRQLAALNPSFGGAGDMSAAALPDGDVLLGDDAYKEFNVAPCASCGGVIKPDFVFFGDTLPPGITESSYELLNNSTQLLCAGTSLAVLTALRLAVRAIAESKPVLVLNIGPTRLDPLLEEGQRIEVDINKSLGK